MRDWAFFKEKILPAVLGVSIGSDHVTLNLLENDLKDVLKDALLGRRADLSEWVLTQMSETTLKVLPIPFLSFFLSLML